MFTLKHLLLHEAKGASDDDAQRRAMFARLRASGAGALLRQPAVKQRLQQVAQAAQQAATIKAAEKKATAILQKVKAHAVKSITSKASRQERATVQAMYRLLQKHAAQDMKKPSPQIAKAATQKAVALAAKVPKKVIVPVKDGVGGKSAPAMIDPLRNQK